MRLPNIFVNSQVCRECWGVKFSRSPTIMTLFGLRSKIANTQHLAFRGKAFGKRVKCLPSRDQLFENRGDKSTIKAAFGGFKHFEV